MTVFKVFRVYILTSYISLYTHTPSFLSVGESVKMNILIIAQIHIYRDSIAWYKSTCKKDVVK